MPKPPPCHPFMLFTAHRLCTRLMPSTNVMMTLPHKCTNASGLTCLLLFTIKNEESHCDYRSVWIKVVVLLIISPRFFRIELAGLSSPGLTELSSGSTSDRKDFRENISQVSAGLACPGKFASHFAQTISTHNSRYCWGRSEWNKIWLNKRLAFFGYHLFQMRINCNRESSPLMKTPWAIMP